MNFKKFLLNKKLSIAKFFLTTFFVFLISFLPIFAHALSLFSIGDFTKKAVDKIFEGAVSFVVVIVTIAIIAFSAIVLFLANVYYGICGLLLNWVTIGKLARSISFTRGGVVDVGLEVTTALANIFIVFILIIIAYATIFRKQTYSMERTLPVLVIVALLINFAPTLCGVVIDFTNAFTNYFIANPARPMGGFSGALERFKVQIQGIGGQAKEMIAKFVKSPTSAEVIGYNSAEILGLILGHIFFNLLAGTVLLLFTLLFFLRIIAIWILVILSPLAFASAVIPTTRRMIFDRWINQFLQWSFVGITGGFFLYLADVLMRMLPEEKLDTALTPTLSGGLHNLAFLFPYLVPVAFAYIGFIATLQTGAVGAKMATTLGVKVAGAIRGAVVKKPLKGVGKRVGEGLERRFKVRERAGRVAEWARKTPVIRHAAKIGITKPLETYVARTRAEILNASKEADKFPAEINIEHVVFKTATGREAVGKLYNAIVEKGQGQTYWDVFKKRLNVKSDEELLRHPTFRKETEELLRLAFAAGLGSDIVRRDPRLAAVLAGKRGTGFNFEDTATKEEAIRKVVNEMRPRYLSDTPTEAFEDKDVVKAFAELKGIDMYRSAIREVKGFVPTFMKSLDEVYAEFVAEKQRQGITNKEEIDREFAEKFGNYFRAIRHDYLKSEGMTAPAGFSEKIASELGVLTRKEAPKEPFKSEIEKKEAEERLYNIRREIEMRRTDLERAQRQGREEEARRIETELSRLEEERKLLEQRLKAPVEAPKAFSTRDELYNAVKERNKLVDRRRRLEADKRQFENLGRIEEAEKIDKEIKEIEKREKELTERINATRRLFESLQKAQEESQKKIQTLRERISEAKKKGLSRDSIELLRRELREEEYRQKEIQERIEALRPKEKVRFRKRRRISEVLGIKKEAPKKEKPEDVGEAKAEEREIKGKETPPDVGEAGTEERE